MGSGSGGGGWVRGEGCNNRMWREEDADIWKKKNAHWHFLMMDQMKGIWTTCTNFQYHSRGSYVNFRTCSSIETCPPPPLPLLSASLHGLDCWCELFVFIHLAAAPSGCGMCTINSRKPLVHRQFMSGIKSLVHWGCSLRSKHIAAQLVAAPPTPNPDILGHESNEMRQVVVDYTPSR